MFHASFSQYGHLQNGDVLRRKSLICIWKGKLMTKLSQGDPFKSIDRSKYTGKCLIQGTSTFMNPNTV